MTLTEYRARLTKVETAIDACIQTGEQYTVVGSHSNKRVSLDDLRRERDYLRKKILRLEGYSATRTRPDFT